MTFVKYFRDNIGWSYLFLLNEIEPRQFSCTGFTPQLMRNHHKKISIQEAVIAYASETRTCKAFCKIYRINQIRHEYFSPLKAL